MGFGSEMLEWKKAIDEMPMEERTLCPECSYPLEKHEAKGLHCPYCGWCEHLSVK